MKVLAINGSARKDGNTEMLVQKVFAELARVGVECESIQLAGSTIDGCKACWSCGGKENCVFSEDSFLDIFEKMKRADGIILASPVYVGGISSSIQALLERAAVVCDMNRDANLLKRKVGTALVAARRGGAVIALDGLVNFFLLQNMYVVGSMYWPIAYGQMPGDVSDDAEGMETMINLGKNMAHLLKALKESI